MRHRLTDPLAVVAFSLALSIVSQAFDALMAAAGACRERTLELLLLNGADPSARTDDGRSALGLAASTGAAEAARMAGEEALARRIEQAARR